jgi:uncharacterized membrane protein YccC
MLLLALHRASEVPMSSANLAASSNGHKYTYYKVELLHAVRTTVAAVASLLLARLLHMPEAYWAPITTIVVMQSTLGAALTVSSQRLAGTAMGAAMGAVLATCFPPNFFVFGAGIFVLGVICMLLHLDRAAYRFAGITLAIVLLVERNRSPWILALHRFIEVGLGIVVALALTAVWPERNSPPG